MQEARVRAKEQFHERLERTVLAPLTRTGPVYRIVMVLLFGIVAWGAYAFRCN